MIQGTGFNMEGMGQQSFNPFDALEDFGKSDWKTTLKRCLMQRYFPSLTTISRITSTTFKRTRLGAT